jgi:Domain of unknown function (DUF1929)
VLTAGGGAPGPVNELNAEIYYPPYLYLKDGSGNPAPRPTVISAPSSITVGQGFLLTVGANDKISSINLIRVGASTHDFNSEQRLIPLPFTQNGTQISATLNASPQLMPPGYYMLFALNSSGVPAVAPIIPVLQPLPDLVPTSLSYASTFGLLRYEGDTFHNQAFGKHNGHWERGLRSGKNSARLLYALCIQHKWQAGSGENYLRYPSRPVSLVEGRGERSAPSSWLLSA